MCFAARVACAVLLISTAYLSIGCGDDGTEPAKDDPTPTWGHIWSRRFGDADDQMARAVAVDSFGSAIVAGNFHGVLDFDGDVLTSAGGKDVFLVKLGSSSGARAWSMRFGDVFDQTVQSVAIDGDGNVVIAGFFGGTVDFGGGVLTSTGGEDIFVAKFAPNGVHSWSKRFGDAGDQEAIGLALDSDGSVIVVGAFWGSVDFGGGTLTSAGEMDIFAAKLDAGGNHIWSKHFGDGISQFAASVAVDGSGNAFVAGTFKGSMDFGGGALTSAGADDIFVAKLDPDGGHLWSKRFGDASAEQQAWGVAIDEFGNAIVAGQFTGTVDFGGGLFSCGGQTDIFVAKFDNGGAHVWSKRFGDMHEQYANAVAVDPSDNILIAGGFYMTVDFGGGSLTSGGTSDAYIAKLGPDGSHMWSDGFGTADYQDAWGVAADPSGSAILAGYMNGTADFGGGTLVSPGGTDVFVAKFGLR
jgi:hypothetical protein